MQERPNGQGKPQPGPPLPPDRASRYPEAWLDEHGRTGDPMLDGLRYAAAITGNIEIVAVDRRAEADTERHGERPGGGLLTGGVD
ncbi:MAG: hypothetical protein ACRDTG_29240 [Pseudonocardiaceae bacterium]